MNERIRELAEQAEKMVEHSWGDPNYRDDDYNRAFDEWQEKFAELIVKETITEMCQQLYWHGEDQSNNPSFYKAIDKTKKQFGVEE